MESGLTTEEWLRGRGPIESGASLADGTEAGRWRIVAFVACGGAGEVYRAAEVNGKRTAALKILHRTDAAARTRFEREAQVLSELRDPTFPIFFESGEYQGRPWYATEFLQPLDLPMTDAAVARLVRAICRGAGALHARGFVHRDIKPANILSRNGEPVLIDLGLLKRAETPALHPGGTISIVDGRPVGVGTPGYAAPEQFLGGEISPAADIHAIGVLASTCFGGKPPRVWRNIIRRATSSLPAERYPDVASLAQAVRMRHLPAALGVAAVVAVATSIAVVAVVDRLKMGNIAGEPHAPPEVRDGDSPIVASERMRQKLADQGRNLPNVTPNQIRQALDKLEKGMVPIPGRDFEMCMFEVTQAVWEPIAGFNPSKEKGPDLPVSNVTMADIEEFLENLNNLPEIRASGKKFRLPTAEEWEYACLAGGTNGFCRLADGRQITAETLGEVAWFGRNSKNKPHPVCMKKPNALGLHDMHGNVAEFTSTRKAGDMFEYIWKGNAYNGDNPDKFRADLSPSITYGLSFNIAGFRLAR